MPKVLKIRELGDTVLRKKTKSVSQKEMASSSFKKFIANLVQTCDEEGGMGIAAPQVVDKTWQSKNIFIVWSRPSKNYPDAPEVGPIAIINPKIVSRSKRMKKEWEGCLSIPGFRAKVSRHASLEVEFQTIDGKKHKAQIRDFIARIFQHEFDHVSGILYIDRVEMKDIVSENEYKKIISKRK